MKIIPNIYHFKIIKFECDNIAHRLVYSKSKEIIGISTPITLGRAQEYIQTHNNMNNSEDLYWHTATNDIDFLRSDKYKIVS